MEFDNFSQAIIDDLSKRVFYSELPMENLKKIISKKLETVYKDQVEKSQFLIELKINKGEIVTQRHYEEELARIKKDFLKEYENIARLQ